MGYQILVVDGNPRLCDLIRDMLTEERRGDTVLGATSASDALAMVHCKPADMLIADWQTPDMDGLTLIESVQRLRPATHAILTTATDAAEIKERSRNRPASFALFVKPFAIDAFLTHVDQALNQSNTASSKNRAKRKPSVSALQPALSWR